MIHPPLSSPPISQGIAFEPSWSARWVGLSTSPRALVGYTALTASLMAGLPSYAALACSCLALLGHEWLTNVLTGGNTLRAATFLAADHFSIYKVKGGLPYLILPPVIEALDKIGAEDAEAIKNCLGGILHYENHFNCLAPVNRLLINDFLASVHLLQEGQMIGFPLVWLQAWPYFTGHVMMSSLHRQGDGRWLLRLYNGDEQNQEYHYRRYDPTTYSYLHQAVLEIEGIEEAHLKQFIRKVAPLHQFSFYTDYRLIYQSLSLLRGNFLPPSSDPRYWVPLQQGYSCSGYSIKCLIKALLSPSSYEQFEMEFLQLTTSKLRQAALQGHAFDSTKDHQRIYQELRSKLLRRRGADPGIWVASGTSPAVKNGLHLQRLFWNGLFKPSEALFHKDYSPSNEEFRHLLYSKEFSSLREKREQWTTALHPFGERSQPTIRETSENLIKEIERRFYSLEDKYNKSFNERSLKELNIFLTSLIQISDSQKVKSELQKKILVQKIEEKINYFLYFCFLSMKVEPDYEISYKIIKSIKNMKNRQFKEARDAIEELYLSSLCLESMAPEETEECALALLHLLLLSLPRELEFLELASALIFLFINKKIATGETNRRGHPVYKKIIPEGLVRRLFTFYARYRLDLEFPDSPWTTPLLDYMRQHRREFFYPHPPTPNNSCHELLAKATPSSLHKIVLACHAQAILLPPLLQKLLAEETTSRSEKLVIKHQRIP